MLRLYFKPYPDSVSGDLIVTTEDFIKKKKNEPPTDKAPTPFITARMRENITGWLFISPAMTIIAVFGIFPIGYAVYMSFFRWRVKQGKFLDIKNMQF